MDVQKMIADVCMANGGQIYTRSLATRMKGEDGCRSTVHGNLGKAYYQLHKAEVSGYLAKHGVVWKLTEAGKVWCGFEGAAVNVANIA